MKPKTIPQLTEVAAELMQLLVRLKAANWNGYCVCATCGVIRHYKDRMQGGHFIGRHWTATRLLEENIHPQCSTCNGPQRGMPIAFTLFMIDMYGIEFVRELLEIKGKTKKYKRPEINKLIQELKGRIKVEEARLDTNSINDVPIDSEKRRYDLTIPWPPAVDDYYTHSSSKGTTKVRSRDSDKVMNFQKQVYNICQGKNFCTLGNKELLGRKLKFTIFAYPPKEETCFNSINKALFDALKVSGIYKNNHDIDNIRVIRKDVVRFGKVKIIIETV